MRYAVRHLVACLGLFGAAASFAQTPPKWWWELQSGTVATNQPLAVQNTGCTTSCAALDLTSSAAGTGVQLNKSLAAQPPIVMVGSPGGSLGYTITATNPPLRDVQVAVTDNKQVITRSTANAYFITVSNVSTGTAPVRLALAYRAPSGSTAPTPTFSNPVCTVVPAGSTCTVTGAASASLSLAAGATAQLQWSATTIGATVTRIQVEAVASYSDGSSDMTPSNNTGIDIDQIN